MNRKLSHGLAAALLVVCVTLTVWQGSFSFGDYGPSNPEQTVLLWAVSTLVFLLLVTLSFMLFRTALKLYIERRSNREGSRIKTKLVAGATALSFLPVFFLVVWGVYVLNRTLEKWFSRPAENIRLNLEEIGKALQREAGAKVRAQAQWMAGLPETRALLNAQAPEASLDRLCSEHGIYEAFLERGDGVRLPACSARGQAQPARLITARAPLADPEARGAVLVVQASAPLDMARQESEISHAIHEWHQLRALSRETRRTYILLLLLIGLFILFVATWIAQLLARQISEPISALLEAAGKLRKGDLSTRVRVKAMDELATLVRAFNEMTEELQSSGEELERRRRFTEAILDNVPSGVISLSADGQIQRVNRALARIFPESDVQNAGRLEDLFSRQDAAEIRYLCKRARRTGFASGQTEFESNGRTLHLSITASALEDRINSGFVLVLEDTSEALRAQKAAAWHEVARRVAHEIKNPLTPISLCADRIARQVEKLPSHGEVVRILRECSATIGAEVESVRTLVDEFSQLARFPSAKPAPSDLNEVVENALSVFAGRLDGITIYKVLSPGLPAANIDREQFKRVVINLVDNAAEAMQDSLVKHLFISTVLTSADTIELVVADTGCGVSAEDKEKLFLPYFSTKGRGTGLGLAIVNHILSDHNASIRVEDNPPAGARFIIELPVAAGADLDARAQAGIAL